ncbi:MAG: hydrogenase maturation protease, partial [Candidatus Aminicenantes bacterium]|nr:hydrogenase maturation protease [Candidatus Aminicenantes bacterium]
RICAICSVSHKNAVLRAMEDALDVYVSKKIYYSRELMHMGEMIESHSLHTFLLALPDFLGYPNAIAMAGDFEFEAKIGLEMKNFGNHIMKVYNGRWIHGENAVIGGFGQLPTKEDLNWIKCRAIQFMPFVHKTVALFCGLDYPDNPEDDTLYVCCEPGNNEYGFWGDEILLSNGEKYSKYDYPKVTNEFTVSHSYCKRSRYNGRPFSVGALARVNNLGDRLEDQAGEMYRKYFNDRWKKNPLFHAAAQALEIMYCFERIPQLVDLILGDKEELAILPYTAKEGTGTGLVEAPRGMLVHHYVIKDGLVEYSDIITPTAMNAEEIERYCHIAAQKLMDEGKEEMIRDRMDIVVRAFDPCISCSAHSVEVERVPETAWKDRLWELSAENAPFYVGVGTEDRSDDRAGLEMAAQLKKMGIKHVYTEEDLDSIRHIQEQRPIIFLDAVNMGESPGKITLIPVEYVLRNVTNCHKFTPFIVGALNGSQIKNSFVLGIQPETTDFGTEMSSSVKEAVQKVVSAIKNEEE